MKQEEFADAVLDSKILIPEEVIAFFKYYSSTLYSPMEFSKSVRSGFHDDKIGIARCGRFKSVIGYGWGYGSGQADSINFTAD